ncbi:MAG TPA: TRAP transporter small permease subunit, partial [Methylomirabilota bacterium]|nr:TRAP transporter small permease subunit [Methylomirabilota bacterium]
MTTSNTLLRWSRILDRSVASLALAFAWLALPLLILFTVLNVAGRWFRVGDSAALYELRGDLFFTLVMLSFGYAYLRDGHVRVDIFRGRFTPRTVASIELVGCLAIVMPLSAFLVDYGANAAWAAFAQGERAGAFGDLPLQWLVKASVPLGFLGLLLAAVCVTGRNILFLLGAA